MSDSKYRIAVIGTGMIANAGHMPAWKELKDDVEVVAVSDILADRAKLVAETEGIPHAFGDWEKMLADVSPDIVSICTPNLYHKEQAIAALEAGAHVLCEKPIAGTYADAVAMYDAADGAGKHLMVCQSLRWYNHMIAAKEFASTGKLGEMYYAEVMGMRRRGIPTWGQFHMKKHSGAGPVYDLGVHQLDSLFWLLGNPKVVSVTAQAYTKIGNRDEGLITSLADSGAPLGVLTPRKYDYHEFDVEDMAAGFIRLESGAVVSFKTSWAANIAKEQFNTNILGTEGGLNLDPFALATNMGSYQVDVTPKIPADREHFFAGHFGATAHFIRLIRGEETPVVKREEVFNVMRTLDAIYKSSEEGREVQVDF